MGRIGALVVDYPKLNIFGKVTMYPDYNKMGRVLYLAF